MDKAQTIKLFGTHQRLADALEIERSVVSHWPVKIPAKHALALKHELLTDTGNPNRLAKQRILCAELLRGLHNPKKAKPCE